jgi:hypothetical protein
LPKKFAILCLEPLAPAGHDPMLVVANLKLELKQESQTEPSVTALYAVLLVEVLLTSFKPLL